MSKPRFDGLNERLLRAGIAPSHVQRYLRELRDHYDDLYQAERGRVLQPMAAELAARSKLGSDDTLAESVLAQPELRSIAARYPALVFGAAPFLVWLVLGLVAMKVIQALGMSYLEEMRAHAALERFARIIELTCLVFVRVLPVLFSAAALSSAMRRRASAPWPIAGAALVTMAAASITVISTDNQVGLSTSLLPGFRSSLLCGCDPRVVSALSESLARAGWMLALTLAPYVLWLTRRRAC